MQRSIIFLLFTLALAYAANPDEINCYQYISEVQALYEVASLNNKTADYIYTQDISTVESNYCNKIINPCGLGNGTNISATITRLGSCSSLTKSWIPKITSLSVNDPLVGIRLNYSKNGDNAPISNSVYDYSVVMSCNFSEEYRVQNLTINSFNDSEVILFVESKAGCPKIAYYQLANFVEKYKVIFIVTGIVLGIFECFFGLKMFKPTLFITGFLLVFLLVNSVLFMFALGENPTAVAQWSCFIGSVFLGCIGGFLLFKLEKVGVFCLGVWLGVVGSLLLYNLITVHLSASVWVLYTVTGVLGLIGGIVAYFVWDHVMILSTSIGGAYLGIRACSLFISRWPFPSEFDLANQIRYGEFKSVPPQFYVYLTFIVIMAIGGIVVQYKMKKSSDEERELAEGYGYSTYANV